MISHERLQNSQIPGAVELIGGMIRPIDGLIGYPPRVSKRLFLHREGFCKMFVGVIGPNEVWGLNDLRSLAIEAGKVNSLLGLPSPVNDLVIRTRDVPFEHGKVRLGGTNPMLILRNIHMGFPEMESHSLEYKEELLPSLALWKLFRLKGQNYFLVHEENSIAQRRAIHGRVGILADGSYEVSIGRGVDHARMLGENGFPYVSAAGHDMTFMLNMLAEGKGRGVFGFNSNNWESAGGLASSVVSHVDTLHRALSAVKEYTGSNKVIEFRQYREKERDAGLNVYDWD